MGFCRRVALMALWLTLMTFPRRHCLIPALAILICLGWLQSEIIVERFSFLMKIFLIDRGTRKHPKSLLLGPHHVIKIAADQPLKSWHRIWMIAFYDICYRNWIRLKNILIIKKATKRKDNKYNNKIMKKFRLLNIEMKCP